MPTAKPNRDPAAVEERLTSLLIQEDEVFAAATAAADVAGLPPFSVTPLEGKLLNLLARAIEARNILELGTLAGYSTLWLALALPPGGRIKTVELDPKYAAVARENLIRAQVDDRVDLVVGDALDLCDEIGGPYDMAFLDADKATLSEQLDLVLPRVRRGGLVVCDNVVRDGAVLDADEDDPISGGVWRALQRLAADSRVDATVIQTVGSKRRDGFVLAVVAAAGDVSSAR
jgi:predicted O-methyltransferase YrrM